MDDLALESERKSGAPRHSGMTKSKSMWGLNDNISSDRNSDEIVLPSQKKSTTRVYHQRGRRFQSRPSSSHGSSSSFSKVNKSVSSSGSLSGIADDAAKRPPMSARVTPAPPEPVPDRLAQSLDRKPPKGFSSGISTNSNSNSNSNNSNNNNNNNNNSNNQIEPRVSISRSSSRQSITSSTSTERLSSYGNINNNVNNVGGNNNGNGVMRPTGVFSGLKLRGPGDAKGEATFESLLYNLDMNIDTTLTDLIDFGEQVAEMEKKLEMELAHHTAVAPGNRKKKAAVAAK